MPIQLPWPPVMQMFRPHVTMRGPGISPRSTSRRRAMSTPHGAPTSRIDVTPDAQDPARSRRADRTAFSAGVSARSTDSGSGEVPSRQTWECAFMSPGAIVRPVEVEDHRAVAPRRRGPAAEISTMRPSSMRTSACLGSDAATVHDADAAQEQRGAPLALRASALMPRSRRAPRVVVDPVPVELDAEARARSAGACSPRRRCRAAPPFSPRP